MNNIRLLLSFIIITYTSTSIAGEDIELYAGSDRKSVPCEEQGSLVKYGEPPEQDDIVVKLEIENGKLVGSKTYSNYGIKKFKDNQEVDSKRIYEDSIMKPESKLHPKLSEWLKSKEAHELVTVVLNYNENLKILRFPPLDPSLPRDDTNNKIQMDRIENLISKIKSARSGCYEENKNLLHSQFGARILDSFWLINAQTVELPVSALNSLVNLDNISYVEPDKEKVTPPASQAVSYARELINSDFYFNLGLNRGRIGLIDTGVRRTHSLLGIDTDAVNFDCSDGTCVDLGSVGFDNCNHGTATAAILAGNNNLGDSHRGITALTIDSFNVYSNPISDSPCSAITITSVVNAFQEALRRGNQVIVAEMQKIGRFDSTVSLAADAAFDAGAVVVAANGNFGGDPRTVRSPANAHKVLGVGAHSVWDLSTEYDQSRGPTFDGRIKPDVQAPTGTFTASSAGDDALKIYSATSGATPYAAGAAVLYRNWLRVRDRARKSEPGYVYAMMILSGHAKRYNNEHGAGRLTMVSDGIIALSKTTVTHGTIVEIPFKMRRGKKSIDAAIWWPMSDSQKLNDVNLHLIAPNGQYKDRSVGARSVFEKVSYEEADGYLDSGTWKLRIHGFIMRGGPQQVYWAYNIK